MPASAPQSQNVPVSYPQGLRISPSQATLDAHLQGFFKLSGGLEPPTPSLPWFRVAGGREKQRLVCRFSVLLLNFRNELRPLAQKP
jgi:hypothetical protein